MTSSLPRLLARLAIFLALALLLQLLVVTGSMSENVLALQGKAILASEGRLGLSEFVTAAHPLLPLLITTAVQWAAGWSGMPACAIATAALAAGLAGYWSCRIEQAGYGAGWIWITPLIIFHPFFLMAAVHGLSEVLLVLFIYALASSLYGLRSRCRARDALGAGISLAIIPFCHPAGLAITAVALPLSIFAAPPRHLLRSVTGIALILAFPMVFALGAFGVLGLMFGEAGRSLFIPIMDEQLLAADVLPQSISLLQWPAWFVSAALAIVLALPAIPFLMASVRRRPLLLMPGIIVAASAPLACAIAVDLGLRMTIAGALTPFVGLLPAMLVHGTERPVLRVPLATALAAGFAGATLLTAGTLLPMLANTPSGSRIRDTDALSTGQALAKLDDVLIDANASLQLIAIRGTARGLWTAPDPPFRLSLMRERLDASHVVVSNPDVPRREADALSRTFRDLYANGAPGFALVHDTHTWRIYARRPSQLHVQGDFHEDTRR